MNQVSGKVGAMKRRGIGSIATNLAIMAATAAFALPAILVIEGIKLLSKEDEQDKDEGEQCQL